MSKWWYALAKADENIADCGLADLSRKKSEAVSVRGDGASQKRHGTAGTETYQFLIHCGVIVSGFPGLADRPVVLQRSNVGL